MSKTLRTRTASVGAVIAMGLGLCVAQSTEASALPETDYQFALPGGASEFERSVEMTSNSLTITRGDSQNAEITSFIYGTYSKSYVTLEIPGRGYKYHSVKPTKIVGSGYNQKVTFKFNRYEIYQTD
ncbi:hypothetical protein ACFVW8_10430 [Streptomyces sp. NPDC058221]|uniref:hypothetical protein n=1 Tax=Streptomyces sp. NPDC058221 TaxID=3346388 RepID=UPI0036E5EC22